MGGVTVTATPHGWSSAGQQGPENEHIAPVSLRQCRTGSFFDPISPPGSGISIPDRDAGQSAKARISATTALPETRSRRAIRLVWEVQYKRPASVGTRSRRSDRLVQSVNATSPPPPACSRAAAASRQRQCVTKSGTNDLHGSVYKASQLRQDDGRYLGRSPAVRNSRHRLEPRMDHRLHHGWWTDHQGHAFLSSSPPNRRARRDWRGLCPVGSTRTTASYRHTRISSMA